jgi:hypothetical protein
MDTDLQQHHSHIVYRQALNWHEAKIQKHLLARADRLTMLGLALALISHRLPFYLHSQGVLESPTDLGAYVLANCKEGSDSDRAVAANILLEIGENYLEDGSLDYDSMQIEFLIFMSASLCQQVETRGIQFLECVKKIEKLSGRKFQLDDVTSVAPRCYSDFETRKSFKPELW